MAETGDEGAPTPRGRTLRLALLLSLAVNLLIVGIVAGALIMRAGSPERRAIVSDLSFGPYTAALDEEDRAELRAAWQEHSPGWRAMHQSHREEFAEFVAAVRETPFARERVEDIMRAQQARSIAAQQIARRILADHLARMTPDARAAYADRLERHDHRGPRQGAGPAPRR